MYFDFISQNWLLFLLFTIIILLIILEPIRQRAQGIKMISPLRVTQLVNHDSAQVIDVRKPEEFATGHIPDSTNLPLSDIEQAQEKFAKSKAKPLIVACRTGSRANSAAAKLIKQGFEDIYVISGGVAAWDKEALPLSRS